MTSTDPLLAQRQIMFSLAYLAYAGESLPPFPPPDAQIAALIDAALQNTTEYPAIANQWARVWGPVTWTVPGANGQDNMMFVAKATAPPAGMAQYAVCVRGTNGQVYLDWLIEDFDVLPMVPWAAATSTGASISESTNIGITVLQQMVDATTQQTMFAFLAAEMSALPPGTSATVAFVGHSLGAALSSTLGLLARDTQVSWDPKSAATVTATNFAGPTAGNAAFAAYLDSQFAITGDTPSWWTSPAVSPASFADFVRQPLDVAPQAWNQTTLNNVPEIYNGIGVNLGFEDGLVVATLVGLVNQYIGPNNYTQPNASAPQLGSMADPAIQPGTVDFTTLAEEVEWQHTSAYAELLGCSSLLGTETSPPVVQKLRAKESYSQE
jgi:hypothetical protein